MKNTNKNALFSLKLFWEGMRQLKVIGTMAAVIIWGVAILIPIREHIANLNQMAYLVSELHISPSAADVATSYSLIGLNPLILLLSYVVVPLMALYLFNFMNRRNACDFYHSIPVKRESLFISFAVAILVWNLILLLGSVGITLVLVKILPTVAIRNSIGVCFAILCNIVAACIFILGVFGIAMSITGTPGSNIAVAAMICIVPRLLMTMFANQLSSALSIFLSPFKNTIVNPWINSATGLLFGEIFGYAFDDGFGYTEIGLYTWRSFWFTLIVGILYLILATWLFKKRKSEAATKAAFSSKMQLVIRLLPAITISMIPLCEIFKTCVVKRAALDSEKMFTVISLFIVAILVYFLYEIVSTKKASNLIKTIPGLLGLVVFDIVFYTVLVTSYGELLNDVPDRQKVQSVNVDLSTVSMDAEYIDSLIQKVDLDSPQILDLLTSENARNVGILKRGNKEPLYDADGESIVVTFHQGKQKKVRKVYLSAEANNQLKLLLATDESIKNVISTPVDKSQISDIMVGYSEWDLDQCYEIYEKYMEEVSKMQPVEMYDLILGNHNFKNENQFGNITFWADGIRMYLPITKSTPDTWLYIMEQHNAKDTKPLKQYLDNDTKREEMAEQIAGSAQYSVYIRVCHGNMISYVDSIAELQNGGTTFEVDYTENGKKVLERIQKEFEKVEGQNPTQCNQYIEVRYNFHISGEKSYDMIYHYYPYTEEADRLIQEFGGKVIESEDIVFYSN